MNAQTLTTDATPFSRLLRAASHDQHDEAKNSGFMTDLVGGRLGVEAYARYTEQLLFVYRALETSAEALADDAVAGPFIRPELFRVAEIERDLAHMRGADWLETVHALPSTLAYTARIEECARTWTAGYVAHHYTRYLGDLAGGQIIRGTAEKTWGFAHRGDGVRFYVFENVSNPAEFKRDYHSLLDAIAVDEPERQRVIEECNRAYALNRAVFRDLGEEFPAAA